MSARVCAAGHVIEGTVVSTGVTMKVQVEVFPLASVAVIVTVVAVAMEVPAAGD